MSSLSLSRNRLRILSSAFSGSTQFQVFFSRTGWTLFEQLGASLASHFEAFGLVRSSTKNRPGGCIDRIVLKMTVAIARFSFLSLFNCAFMKCSLCASTKDRNCRFPGWALMAVPLPNRTSWTNVSNKQMMNIYKPSTKWKVLHSDYELHPSFLTLTWGFSASMIKIVDMNQTAQLQLITTVLLISFMIRCIRNRSACSVGSGRSPLKKEMSCGSGVAICVISWA